MWHRLALLLALLGWGLLAAGQGTETRGLLLEIDGPIGPATSNYVHAAMQQLDPTTELVILRMDTPGGLDTAMRDIIQDILSSPVPVVSYVAPAGARAASAGTYILYASHIAAMSPATNLGAATPIAIGMPGQGQAPAPKQGEQPAGNALQHKMVNDAVAYIRSLAQARGRNVEWAEKAVREAASLSAKEALSQGVIDIVATDVSDLLRQLDGRTVKVMGQERTLHTQGLLLQRLAPDWRTRLLSLITNPNIAYVLMLLGIYGLLIEFAHPGLGVPGVVGAICLLLALFAFQALPINYAGLALLILGIALMVAEAFVPSFGVLGIGGTIAFVFGSLFLMESDVPGYGISYTLIGGFALFSLLLFSLLLGMVIKARHRPVVSGQEQLIGTIGEVLADFDSEGRVHLHGENWRARTTQPLRHGQQVRVTARDGLVLLVEPVPQTHTPEDYKEDRA
jgi:membrane-bound serine protease (ClpP class)